MEQHSLIEGYEAEVEQALAKYGDDHDPEGFHCVEDLLMEEGYRLIVAGADPTRIAMAALKLSTAELTRWYA